MARSLYGRTKVPAMVWLEVCYILGPVLKFDIYFVTHWMAILLSEQLRYRVRQIPPFKQKQQQW